MTRLIIPPRYEQHQIQYYPDANFLGAPDNYAFLLSTQACRLVDPVIEEVIDKRDHRVTALLERLIGQSAIADERYFAELSSVSTLKLLRKCACTLPLAGC